MARINVDDDFYLDPRFRALTRKVGDEDKAIGMCIRLWRIAQKYWGKEHTAIPHGVFKLEALSDLLEVGLAEETPEGIYARGSKERFDWYRQRVEAGRKRASSHRDESGRFTSDSPATLQRPLDSAGVSVDKTPANDQPPVLVLAPVLAPALVIPNNKSVCVKPDMPNENTHTNLNIETLTSDFEIAKKWRQWAVIAKNKAARHDEKYFAKWLAKARVEFDLTAEGLARLFNEAVANVFWSALLPDPKNLFFVCKDELRAAEHVIRDAMRDQKKKNFKL